MQYRRVVKMLPERNKNEDSTKSNCRDRESSNRCLVPETIWRRRSARAIGEGTDVVVRGRIARKHHHGEQKTKNIN